MADVHVVPDGDGWSCEVGGEKRSTHATQQEAISQGRELAGEAHGELVIHDQQGQIRLKNRHGRDPRNIPG